MLGKSVGPRGRWLTWLPLFCVLASCAHNVGQDDKTGPDGKEKGAKALTFENNEAKDKGIVTYPGGDRTDWKLIEVPDKKIGTLELQLQWTPPRPGLQLAFDVFDEWNGEIVQSKKTSKKRSKSRVRNATIDNAKGKYFIRIYAVDRGDAGTYKLTVDFKESAAGPIYDPLKLDISNPPRLADIPEVEVGCDESTFDPKIPACKKICPESGAPPGWKACEGKCPKPPDITIEACWATMPCPTPPQEKIKSCTIDKFPDCDLKNPSTPTNVGNPKCKTQNFPPFTGRVIKNDLQGSDVLITISGGATQGITKAWRAQVMRGDSDVPLPSGDVFVIRVDKNQTLGRVHLTTDQLSANPNVKFTPPPRS